MIHNLYSDKSSIYFDDDYEEFDKIHKSRSSSSSSSSSMTLANDSGRSSSSSASSTCGSCSNSDTDDLDIVIDPIPSTDVLKHIVEQIEQYFTDENLIQNEFLCKNIRRNKQDRLELNDLWTKIRRKIPLPPIDDQNKYNRTVVVIGVPAIKANVDLIHHDFAMFGLIHSVRIFDRHTFYPSHDKLFKDIHQKSLSNIAEDHLIASVEFNSKSDAEKCFRSQRILSLEDEEWSSVRIYLAS
ncbi:hypothetical protein HUG17_6709 [Dermatophagoides farinae]|uniref:Uncharacterized protein n=1 Tax=Dermatophagoides farinae TaxID=6954 RepID=A0A9D4SJL2_DERFA|nr:hypothetical protein HUG17_6709 [Dermatophagoides farinae]